ncbi:MAG: hypothetical protein JSW58_14775 [Candidatus Latescibacterota bacterium]|nr:MAG: hypothetical protein JSW58_14775 [Candidatus Latescibacterota bacterium]
MATTLEQLWDDFGYWRTYTAHYQKIRKESPYLRPLKFNDSRRALFVSLQAWCKERHIPDRQWLYSLFAIRRWLFAPKLEFPYLASKKHLARFAEFDDYQFYLNRLREIDNLHALANPSTFDPNRDINLTTETAKAAYLEGGNPQECIDRMFTETFGYHPSSAICNRCMARSACLAQLQASVLFDIVALRRGEITSEQAQSQAIARQQSYA